MTGGTEATKETKDVYEALYHPGQPRNNEQSIQILEAQLCHACQGNSDTIKTMSTWTGIKDKITQFWIDQLLEKFSQLRQIQILDKDTRAAELNDQAVKGDECKAVVEKIRQNIGEELWQWLVKQPQSSYEKLKEDDRMHCGLNQDTPVENLHTWLLGNKKYVWHKTNQPWTKEQDETLAIRLQSSAFDSLTTPQPRAAYLIKYKNSLIGKHFKILQQLGVFHVYGLCSPDIFALWKASGELGALLWFPEIHDMETYLKDLQVLIDNLLDAWAKVNPRRIITKIKLHALVHLPEDIRRFSPSVIFATEIFECFNAIFRTCSILSNHLAPSRDIADSMTGMERFKHMVSGGFWKDKESGSYIQGSLKVREFLLKNSEMQRRLGWVSHNVVPGQFRRLPRQKRIRQTWDQVAQYCVPLKSGFADDLSALEWELCTLVIAQSTDCCKVDSWVFF
ncbi:hypothetical protein VKT23_002715 [Stygiomarasmius scandens]|uniref:Uncharacterized protein n=1 Tax=Marasmiellus scandens TaxID=2682957 RepID=A0ABR1K4P8_9AGAR